MRLIMFDVDGTLTKTTHVDEICFLEAIQEVWQINDVNRDWKSYPHATDSAVAAEIALRHLGRQALPEELKEIRDRFTQKIKDMFEQFPERFQAVDGAPAMIESLSGNPEIAMALATGGYRATALFKLEKGGINIAGIPMATCEDHFERENIMSQALNLASELHEVKSFSTITYVGDAPWDVRASANLGWDFIGVAGQGGARQLEKYGAKKIVRDFSDQELLKRLAEVDIKGGSQGTL